MPDSDTQDRAGAAGVLRDALDLLVSSHELLASEHEVKMESLREWLSGPHGHEYLQPETGAILRGSRVAQYSTREEQDEQAFYLMGGHFPVMRVPVPEATGALEQLPGITDGIRRLLDIDAAQAAAAPRSMADALTGWMEVRNLLSPVSSTVNDTNDVFDGWTGPARENYDARHNEQKVGVAGAIAAVEGLETLLVSQMGAYTDQVESLQAAADVATAGLTEVVTIVTSLIDPGKWQDLIDNFAGLVEESNSKTTEGIRVMTGIVQTIIDQLVTIHQAEAAIDDRNGGRWPPAFDDGMASGGRPSLVQ